MTKVTCIGVTFPPELFKELDEISARTGYKSRSKAIQYAVPLFVSDKNGSEMKRQSKQDCYLWFTTTKSKDYRVDLLRSSTIMLP
jgi:metal-responsive CopG/Arc/MetJ family transcriptional regulator